MLGFRRQTNLQSLQRTIDQDKCAPFCGVYVQVLRARGRNAHAACGEGLASKMQLALQNIDELGKLVCVRWNFRSGLHMNELHLELACYGNILNQHSGRKGRWLPRHILAAE